MRLIRTTILAFVTMMAIIVSEAVANDPHAGFFEADPIGLSAAETYFSVTDNQHPAFPSLSHLTRTNSTTDEDLSDLIKVTARGLNYDPERIFAFVRDNVDVHPVYGESKGALGALLDMEGSVFDQVRLALLLLNESNGKNNQTISAKVHIGTVAVSQSQWMDWYGFDDKKAVCRMLASGAIPSSITDCSVSGSMSTMTIGHAWLDVSVNSATSEIWDLAYKKRHLLTPASGVLTEARKSDAVNGQALTVPFTKIRQLASSGTEGSASVPYISAINMDGLNADLSSASSNLDEYLDLPSHYALSSKQLSGGYVISAFDQPVSKAPLASYTSWINAGYDDIPDKFRIMLRVKVDSVGYSAHPDGDYAGHTAENLIDEKIAADEVYGRLFRLKARPACDYMKYSDSFPVGAHCLMLSVGAENIKEVTRGALIELPGNTNKATPSDKKRVDVTLTYNHPYATKTIISVYPGDTDVGDYQDGVFSKRVGLFSDTIFVNAWGKTSSRLISRWNNRLGLDATAPAHGNPCGISDPSATEEFTCLQKARSSNIVRHKLAASYMAQSSKFMDVIDGLSNVSTTHHRTIGMIYGTHIVKDLNSVQTSPPPGSPIAAVDTPYIASADNSIFLDIRPSVSLTSRTNDSNDEVSARRTFASISSALEGFVFSHVMGAYDTVSTASKFAWAAKKPPRDTDGPETINGEDDPAASFNPVLPKYYLIKSGTFTLASGSEIFREDNFDRIPFIQFAQTLKPKVLAMQQVLNYSGNGYDVVVPSETFLGSGPRKGTTVGIYTKVVCVRGSCITDRYNVNNPHPSRGSAMVAWKDSEAKIGHAIVRRFGIQKGGGISSAPGEFKLPSLPSSDKFIDPASKVNVNYSVDPKSGALSYDTGSLLSVGNSSGSDELSASFSFSSGYKSADTLNQWASNWQMEARVSSSGLEYLGASRPDNAVPSIVAVAALLENYGTSTAGDYDIIAREVAGPLIMNWWGDNTQNNTVSFQQGASGTTYVKKIDGTFNPPQGGVGMKLTQTGVPAVKEFVPLSSPNADFILLKSMYSRKWDFTGVNYALENQYTKTSYAFQGYFGPTWPHFKGDLQNTNDPIDYVNHWEVHSINFANQADVTVSGNSSDEWHRTVSNDRGRELHLNGFLNYGVGDNHNRSVSSEFKVFPTVFTDAQGNSTHIEYYSGDRVQEGVTLTPNYTLESGHAGSISPAYLYEYPFVGIKEIYEPGLIPGTDTPSISVTYDELGNVKTVTDAVGISTHYGQAAGRMSSVIDNVGNEMIYKYDEHGRVIEMIEPSYGEVP